MAIVLVIISILAALAGSYHLTKATEGVGFICLAVLLSIWARLWQAHHQHDTAKKQHEELMGQLRGHGQPERADNPGPKTHSNEAAPNYLG